MGNCYFVCHADFDETVRMVGRSRGLSPEEVKEILLRAREQYEQDPDYKRLRSRLPEDFPV